MIETTRLIIKPLTYNQLLAYSKEQTALDVMLGLNATSGCLSPNLKEAIETTMLPALYKGHTNYLYATLWVVICKQENKIIGGISFTGAPNKMGEIEIGYGCYDEFRKKGFMKEAVQGMLQWAGSQPEVFSVLACSQRDNIASGKILNKNKFLTINTAGEFINWAFKLKNKRA